MKNNQRICPELLELIEKIKEQEEKRTGSKPSYSSASKILYLRIMSAGGLKEAL